MKILIINTSDIAGGAARAAYRLHKGLQSIELNSIMFVMAKLSRDNSVVVSKTFFRKLLGRLAIVLDIVVRQFLSTKNTTLHSFALISSMDTEIIDKINPDIIHMHWICGGFMKPGDLIKINKPIVWTLHDMWAFCGAEHYVGECKRYIDGYEKGNRPKGEFGWDINRLAWNRKLKAWKGLKDITIVTPSNWLAECVRKSILFRNYKVEVIPNGIDTEIFKSINKKVAREKLGLPTNKKLILFGAMGATSDPRKGFKFLKDAIDILSKGPSRDMFELVVFGSSGEDGASDLGLPVHYLGNVNDDSLLAVIYSAADVMVVPSMEDNLPNMIMESISCGTPCVGFDLGGIPDMIDHKENGYLAKPLESEDLARGIEWILNNENYEQLCQNARKKVEDNFDIKIVAGRYGKLYNELMKNNS